MSSSFKIEKKECLNFPPPNSGSIIYQEIYQNLGPKVAEAFSAKFQQVANNPLITVYDGTINYIFYIANQNPVTITGLTGINNININTLAYSTNTVIPDPPAVAPAPPLTNIGAMFMIVNNISSFATVLTNNSIPYTKYPGLAVTGIAPFPGGFNQIINIIGPSNIYFIAQSELGDLIIGCANPSSYVASIQALFDC